MAKTPKKIKSSKDKAIKDLIKRMQKAKETK